MAKKHTSFGLIFNLRLQLFISEMNNRALRTHYVKIPEPSFQPNVSEPYFDNPDLIRRMQAGKKLYKNDPQELPSDEKVL
jgi:hypothetical protein